MNANPRGRTSGGRLCAGLPRSCTAPLAGALQLPGFISLHDALSPSAGLSQANASLRRMQSQHVLWDALGWHLAMRLELAGLESER